MSKALEAFAHKVGAIKNAASKFSATAAEGSRIVLARTKDAEFQLRIDAGHYDALTKQLNVVLQVNSQAKSPALKDYVRSNSTHAQLATATFDTAAEDPKEELARVLDELVATAKEKVG